MTKGDVSLRDWSTAYGKCPRWGHMSGRISKAEPTGGKDWPEGYRKLSGKIYHQTKLCVPESLELEYAVMVHEASGHARTTRLAKELGSRAIVSNTQKLAASVVQHCQECQATEWLNQKKRRRRRRRFMSMPTIL